jgi:hypothetical protein
MMINGTWTKVGSAEVSTDGTAIVSINDDVPIETLRTGLASLMSSHVRNWSIDNQVSVGYEG